MSYEIIAKIFFSIINTERQIEEIRLKIVEQDGFDV